MDFKQIKTILEASTLIDLQLIIIEIMCLEDVETSRYLQLANSIWTRVGSSVSLNAEQKQHRERERRVQFLESSGYRHEQLAFWKCK
jgi:hypothetical protein